MGSSFSPSSARRTSPRPALFRRWWFVKAQGYPLGRGFAPWQVVGGDALPAYGYRLYEARRFKDTPVRIGTNSDEGSMFVPPHTTPSQFEVRVRAQFGPFAAEVLAAYPHVTEAESSLAAADLVRDSKLACGAWAWARWPAFSASSQRVMYLDAHPHPGPVPNLEKLKVLDTYFTWARQQQRSPAQNAALIQSLARRNV